LAPARKKKQGEIWIAVIMVGASEEGGHGAEGRVHRSHVIRQMSDQAGSPHPE